MFWAIPLGIFLVFLVPEIIFLACLCIAAVYNDVLTKFKTRGNILGKVRNTQSPETAHEAAALAGYRLEDCAVTTKDGYVLTLHKLVGDVPVSKGHVLLQHGLYQSSMLFLINKTEHSLAFTLMKLGYQVWLGNNRGNIHSRKHIKYSCSDREFWQFGIDELANDVVGFVRWIKESENGRLPLYYIGHSQGSTQAMMALCGDAGQLGISAFVALSPGAFVNKFPKYSPLRYLCQLVDYDLRLYFRLFGDQQFLPIIEFLKEYVPKQWYQYLSYIHFSYLFEWTDKHWDADCQGKLFTETPAGTSSQTIAHWMQQAQSFKFQAFDYGNARENIKVHGSSTPPAYDLKKLTIPTMIVHGTSDILLDFQKLAHELPNCKQCLQISQYEHLDTILANNAHECIYPAIYTFLQRYAPKLEYSTM